MGGHVTEFESMSQVIPDSVQGFDIIRARCKETHLFFQKLGKKIEHKVLQENACKISDYVSVFQTKFTACTVQALIFFPAIKLC